MANSNNPFGFEVLQSEGKENRSRVYNKTAAIIYQGDVLKADATGAVVVAAAGDTIIGVAAEYKAAADATISVYDDPEAVFMAQCSADFAEADSFQNANIVASAGDSTLKRSNHSIDSASFGTELAKQFKILGLVSRGVNAVGSYAMVRVKPNAHLFKSGVTGV